MKSHEVFRKALRQGNPKQLAAALGVSLSTLYKWSETGESGRRNPLERIAALVRATNDPLLVQWLCQQAGGYFVPNPQVKADAKMELLPATCALLEGFASVEGAMARAAKDNRMTRGEWSEISQRWEMLKSSTEAYLTGCRDEGSRPSVATARLAA